MHEQNEEILQRLLSYYRNKCNQLEYDFLFYQAKYEKRIEELESSNNGGSNIKASKVKE